MTITVMLKDVDREIQHPSGHSLHDNLPPGVSTADNEHARQYHPFCRASWNSARILSPALLRQSATSPLLHVN
jgi:hypothetical protein